MPDTDYLDDLDGLGEFSDEWIRVRFTTVKDRVTHYTVQYETIIGGKRFPVVRYDNAHGEPHLDILDRRGGLVTKAWITGADPNAAMTEAIDEITDNWEAHRRRFESE